MLSLVKNPLVTRLKSLHCENNTELKLFKTFLTEVKPDINLNLVKEMMTNGKLGKYCNGFDQLVTSMGHLGKVQSP